MDDVPLNGGRMNVGVVRVGDTVRRALSPWSPTIHRVLTHAREHGVTWVPRFRGIDADGREILDFIEGDVGHGDPIWIRSDRVLKDVRGGTSGTIDRASALVTQGALALAEEA